MFAHTHSLKRLIRLPTSSITGLVIVISNMHLPCFDTGFNTPCLTNESLSCLTCSDVRNAYECVALGHMVRCDVENVSIMTLPNSILLFITRACLAILVDYLVLRTFTLPINFVFFPFSSFGFSLQGSPQRIFYLNSVQSSPLSRQPLQCGT